jgi:CDP-diacylglycerol--serine O-phosphatidyltransferase
VVAFRYAVPNLLTGASFVLGLMSIVNAELGRLEQAAWLIVWCVLLDVADGIAARLLRATSEFGAEFDSFADLVAFGLAPAALVLHFVWQTYPGAVPGWIAAACAIYALFAAMRLARFNTFAPVQAGWFRGVPTTACGALLATGVILLVRYEDSLGGMNWPLFLVTLMAALGIAMISNLRFPKLALADTRWLNIPHVANILALYIFGSLQIFPEYQFGCAVLVLVVGLTLGFVRRPAPA